MQSALNQTLAVPQKCEPVRVLHCIPTLAGGGAETQLRRMAPRLVDIGIETAIFSRLADADVASFESKGVATFPIRARGNHNPALAKELLDTVSVMRPTIIQTWLTQMDIMGGAIALAKHIPWILSERASQLAYGHGLKDRVRRALGVRASLVVANSLPGLEVWPNARATAVIPNGLDLAQIQSVPSDTLRSTAFFSGRFVVVSICRLHAGKAIDILIRAVAIARKSIPAICLVIVGDGPEYERLKKLSDDLSMEDHICFAGHQEDPLTWMRSADAFTSASEYEGQPNAVMEAAACGLPMVLSDIDAHRLLMGEAACYAPPGDAEAFAAVFAQLALSGDRRAMLSAAAKGVASQMDISNTAAAYATEYRRLADRSPAHSLNVR